MLGMAGLGLLGLAAWLEPNPLGHGTHQQLGLPMCGVLVWAGRPCPACGMTTSWSNLMRGRLLESIRANPAGTWLAAWVLGFSLWVVIAGGIGRWFFAKPNPIFFLGWLLISLIMVLTVWSIRFFF